MDMIEPWMKTLASIKRSASFMRTVHWVAHRVFKGMGFQWELRRNGDLKLGIWRKTFKQKNQRSPYPKRFVLIPGFGDTPLSWYFVISLLEPVLKQNYDEIILIDFPGFGGFLSSERSFPTMDLMMSTVNDTLDSLKP